MRIPTRPRIPPHLARNRAQLRLRAPDHPPFLPDHENRREEPEQRAHVERRRVGFVVRETVQGLGERVGRAGEAVEVVVEGGARDGVEAGGGWVRESG